MFLISNTVMWAGIAAISVAIMLICVGIGFIIFDYIKSSIIYFLVSVLFVIIGISYLIIQRLMQIILRN